MWLAGLLALTLHSTDLAAQSVLKLAHSFPLESALGSGAQRLANEIERASVGSVRVSVYGDSTLGSASAALELVRSGELDLAIVPISAFQQRNPDLRVFDMPFLFEHYGTVQRFQRSDAGRKLLDSVELNGPKGLAYWHGSTRVLATKRSVSTPRDLKGLKLIESNPRADYAQAFAQLGASTSTLAFGEVHAALQAGAMDGVDTTIEQAERANLENVTKYVTLTNHAYAGYIVVADPKILGNRAVQDAITTAIERVTPEVNAAVVQQQRVSLERLRQSGVEIAPLSESQRAEWRREVEPTWKAFATTPSANRLIESAIAAGGGWTVSRPPPPVAAARRATPPPAPPPAPAPAPAPPSVGVFWNSWMERNGVLTNSPLTIGQNYTFRIDLARYRYAVSADAAGKLLEAEVRTALERNERTITLYVRPLVIGSAIAWGADAKSEYRVEVSLEKLKAPSADQHANDALIWSGYRDGKVPIDDLSDRFHAVRLRLPVVALGPGCGRVALSIWDGTGLRPLDHVVYSTPVGASDACGQAGESVSAGFSTVVEMAPSATNPPSRPDAALQIFDLPQPVSDVRGIGFLVDATPLANNKPPAVFHWPLFESITTYVTDPSNLLTVINAGRKNKTYAAAARELRKVVFPQVRNVDGTDGPGEVAFQALQRIVRDASHDPVVLVRVTSAERRPVYAPLSLLSTTGGPLVGRPIRVVHPAPFPPSSLHSACLGPWTYAVPASLASYQGDVLAELDRKWISSNSHDTVDSLRTFLGSRVSAAKSSPAEGLLLLAHQSKGNIWFDKDHERVRIGDLTRTFSPGSVAVLSACSVASADSDNDLWVDRLSRQGVSAIFASPFPVDLHYGIELARSFIHAVRQAQQLPHNAEAPSIASLFVSASEEAAKQLNIAPLDVQREFVWIGDPDIKLCK